MKINFTLIFSILLSFCAVLSAGDLKLNISLSEKAFFQDEAVTAEINIINVSTSTLTLAKPVEGGNIWIELRNSSNTYIGTRPIRMAKNISKDTLTLAPGKSLILDINIPAEIKTPLVPVKSTSSLSNVRARLQKRLNNLSFEPGNYYVKAVYFSALKSSGVLFSGNLIGAVMSNKEKIYVKKRE